MEKNNTLLQGFEWYLPADGTFWNKVKALAPSFYALGIDVIWLPPAYKCHTGGLDAGYGVYDLYDLGEFDQKGSVRTKYGTRDEYLACIDALHQAHISVLPDIVMNHRMGADVMEYLRGRKKKSWDRRKKAAPEREIGVWTKFTFPNRNGKYSDFVFDHTCFNGIDRDEIRRKHAIFLFQGSSWSDKVDREYGNYDYLMGCNVDTRVPKVRQELIRWGKWYLDTTHADGFRLDAVKHIDYDFLRDWLQEMRSHAGRNLFAVGEYWHGNTDLLVDYLNHTGHTMSLFDVNLHFRFKDASIGPCNMARIFDGSLVQREPYYSVTFVDNHDSQPGQSLESFVERWFKLHAYALILLRQDGLPCVFYGDLYGIPHDQIPPVEHLDTLIRVRRECAYGITHDYFDHNDIIGWTREGAADLPLSGLACLMSHDHEGRKWMYTGHRNRQMVNLLNPYQTVWTNNDSYGEFYIEAGRTAVYVLAEAFYELIR